MTTHDAATRERVAKALCDPAYGLGSFDGLDDYQRARLFRMADAALSALQPPPKGWEVSQRTRDAMYAIPSSMSDDDAVREITPYLLRDLADGVSEAQIDRAWNAAADLNANTPLNFLRALADTLEGKA